MLSAKNRANTKTVESVFKSAKSIHSPVLTFKFILKSTKSIPQISFIAPKSVAKGAVERNTLRRRGYQVLKRYIDKFSVGTEGVFLFKKNLTMLEVENEIKNILSKIN